MFEQYVIFCVAIQTMKTLVGRNLNGLKQK